MASLTSRFLSLKALHSFGDPVRLADLCRLFLVIISCFISSVMKEKALCIILIFFTGACLSKQVENKSLKGSNLSSTVGRRSRTSQGLVENSFTNFSEEQFLKLLVNWVLATYNSQKG